MTTISITDESHWHSLRRKHVGASEVSALFNSHPYLTEFELYLKKAGKIPSSARETERTKWGNALEGAIATQVAKDLDIAIENPKKYYVSERCSRMGATPDRIILDEINGSKGILEIKNVDYFVYKRWKNEEIPDYYFHQPWQQMECCGCKWGMIVFLIGGNFLIKKQLGFNDEIVSMQIEKIEELYKRIADDNPPLPCENDLELLTELYAQPNSEKILDATEDVDFNAMCASWTQTKKTADEYTNRANQYKAFIKNYVKDASLVNTKNFVITNKVVTRNSYHVKESTFQKLSIKEKKNARR